MGHVKATAGVITASLAAVLLAAGCSASPGGARSSAQAADQSAPAPAPAAPAQGSAPATASGAASPVAVAVQAPPGPAASDAAAGAAAAPQTAASVLARGLTSDGRAEAQVVEADRDAGVLTIKIRFVPIGDPAKYDTQTLYGSPQDIKDSIFVIAGDRKYVLLKDGDGAPLAPDRLIVEAGGGKPLAAVWWGKFPAPPKAQAQVALVLPGVEQIGPIAVADE